MDLKENKTLINALRKGEEKAYMFLLDTYHRRLHAYALTLVDDHSLAQDIVQNVFLRTWQHREKLNHKFTIQSFLYKSVYNEFVNTYKKDKAMMLLQMKYYESLHQEVEKTDEKTLEEIIQLVTKEVEKLPPKCKQIFSLSKKEGLTNIEISEYLNVSIKTVEAHITKAFTILKNKLDDKIKISLFLLFGFPVSEKPN
ncbi:RNA polymerase sigma factor [Flavivirga algicola]|uniref:RNA polymerase sigma-70 factor n=1 Tax=Flavivirga algicola TaxID=2729136 RepID=A0ABX1RT83_9FLAO|nr:RNA polymerase sigma-70 factor [Flavivirga algicola]NMH86756.1 RNA polymerase sigma-70 factor [Flavivirga algicola]